MLLEAVLASHERKRRLEALADRTGPEITRRRDGGLEAARAMITVSDIMLSWCVAKQTRSETSGPSLSAVFFQWVQVPPR